MVAGSSPAGLPLLRTELEAFLGKNPDLQRPLTLVTYARELARRSHYRGQGRPVLALWRELAWKEGRPDKKFQLEVRPILGAERILLARLAEVSH